MLFTRAHNYQCNKANVDHDDAWNENQDHSIHIKIFMIVQANMYLDMNHVSNRNKALQFSNVLITISSSYQ